MARGQWQRAGAAADRSRRAVPGAPDPGQGEAPRPHGGSGSGASCHRAYVAQARFARRPCSGLIGPRLGWRAVPDEGAPTCGNVATGRQERPATPVSGSPVGGSNRGRGCVHRRVPARGRRGPVVGGHANQSQVKGGCRHGQAWVMDPGRCGPDPGERVSVEGGALEPGSGRCTVDPGAQLDKYEHNRGGARTLRLTSRVACGQVHRVWITGSSGSRSHLVTAAPGGSAPRDRALLSAL